MTEEFTPQQVTTVNPDEMVIKSPKSARDLFLIAMKGNPQNLAAALSTKVGEAYTLNVTIGMHFTRGDVLQMLRDGGYTVDFPGNKETK